MRKSLILHDLTGGLLAHCPVGRTTKVGRGSESDVVCPDKHVSRTHCHIVALDDGRLKIHDMSTYGTFIDGVRVKGEAYAKPGQRVVLGHQYTLDVVGTIDPDAPQTQLEPVPPRRIGANYILLREVGRGGMGIVYEAWDEREQRRCAIKWLRGGGDADDEAVTRFKREVMLQGKLGEYPGIVTIFDLGVVTGSGELFCVMEFVEGESFLDKVRNESLSRVEGVRVIARVARAAAYAHGCGVVHRDIKPANVMITPEGQVRLTDFGIAKALDQSGRVTMTGLMMGTPGYMAPEQITDSKQAGPPADIYALGALLFTFLTGKLPIRGKNLREALKNASKGIYGPSPRELDPTIDPVLEAACRRALSYEPANRWPCAEDFAKELERYAKETSDIGRIHLRAPD